MTSQQQIINSIYVTVVKKKNIIYQYNAWNLAIISGYTIFILEISGIDIFVGQKNGLIIDIIFGLVILIKI